MVAPLMGIYLRQIAKAAVRKPTIKSASKSVGQAAKKGYKYAKKTERQRLNQQLSNIRKRYNRAMKYAHKRSESAKTQEEKEKWRTLEELYEGKKEKYKVSRFNKGVKRKSEEYELNIRKMIQLGNRETGLLLVRKSARNKLAQEMLQGNIGSQFLAATKELWYQPGEKLPNEIRFQRIIEKMGAKDLLDAIEKLNVATGVDFTDPSIADATDGKYNELVVLVGQQYVRTL